MNKNTVIFVLFVAALLGSTWGAVVNRQKIDQQQQLTNARAELRKLRERTGQGNELIQGMNADVQEGLAEKEAQLDKDRTELAELRTKKQALEARLSESAVAIDELSREKEALARQLDSNQATEIVVQENTAGAPQKFGGEGGAGQEGGAPQEQLQTTDLAVERVQQRLDEVNAQLLGLEKIVDEKSAALQEAAAEKERLQINRDVLLAKIADQQREVQAIREENRELVKQLAARNEMGDPQEKLPLDKK